MPLRVPVIPPYYHQSLPSPHFFNLSFPPTPPVTIWRPPIPLHHLRSGNPARPSVFLLSVPLCSVASDPRLSLDYNSCPSAC
ncbi:hypothetical protein NPIL_414611 [Nephila pilipes]|uniref:Uncharacterized protein n=1 Tax=Nephila pilipes TaxID=299642 RepID=A0A8X6NQ50_NEPPI|nr:hypothetical protein NPIL_414611 [Nephila pilipes]